MKNFILFIVAVSVLSLVGFVAYRVYVKGESAGDVFQELRGEEKPDVMAEAEDAYDRKDYAEAVKYYEIALQNHESNEPGAELSERDHRKVLKRLAGGYTHLWKEGGKTDESLRIKGERVCEKYIKEYPGRGGLHNTLKELKNPTPEFTKSKVEDESPPK